MPIQRFPISTEYMNDNHKRRLTLFLKLFTFQEVNSIFHKHGIAFSFLFAVCKNCKTVILFSLNVVAEVKFMPSHIKCSSKVLTVLLGKVDNSRYLFIPMPYGLKRINEYF